MTIFEKAREIGEMANCTKEAAMRDEAAKIFNADENAVKKMAEYEAYYNEVGLKMQEGNFDEDAFKDATFKLKKMGMELQVDSVIGPFIEATNNYNKMLNQVFQIIKATATGEDFNGCGGCGCEGDCECDGESCCGNEGCGCGHKHE